MLIMEYLENGDLRNYLEKHIERYVCMQELSSCTHRQNRRGVHVQSCILLFVLQIHSYTLYIII